MKQLLKTINDFEDAKTLELFNEFSSLKQQGFLTKEKLLKILRWKSPRPLRFYESNDEKFVQETTKLAFTTKDENLKIHILTALNGVNYPAASAILMFYDRSKYPVLDIRVWKQLYKFKLVDGNERGQSFSLQQWNKYLKVIRNLAAELNITVRQTEKRIFDHDRNTQTSPIYKKYKAQIK